MIKIIIREKSRIYYSCLKDLCFDRIEIEIKERLLNLENKVVN